MATLQVPNPKDVEIWFPLAQQQLYVDHVIGRSGLTPTQSRHIVRLWAYAYYLKRHESDRSPIKTLKSGCYRFFCSQSEAADLFYGEAAGTSRSAGLMIQQFVSKKFVRCDKFSGSKTRLNLWIPPEFELRDNSESEEVESGKFDARNEADRVARFLKELYSYDDSLPSDSLLNIRRGLENWAERYPEGLRVLRYRSSQHSIGFTAIVPVDKKSERNFYLPPKHSLHLNRFDPDIQDPIEIAQPGDEDCRIAYIRSWQIQPDLWTFDNALKLLNETQQTLRKMHSKHPNLSDVYSMTIHPRLEDFARTLGFQVMHSDSDTSLRWLHIPLDSFLELDSESTLLNFDYPYWLR